MSIMGEGARDVIIQICRNRMKTPAQAIRRYGDLLNESLERALRDTPGDAALLELRADTAAITRGTSGLAEALDRLGEGAGDAEDETAFLNLIRNQLRGTLSTVRNAAEMVKDGAEDIPGGRRIASDAEDLIEEADRAVGIVSEVGERKRDGAMAFDLFKVWQQGMHAATYDAEEKIGRGTVLVIDSDPSMGNLICKLIERFDCECLLVSSGTEAFQYLERLRPDLILTDLMLDDMTGFDILRRLKDQEDDTPVIILSAIEDEKFMVACIGMGARDYLHKPPPTTLLKARIKAALDKKFFDDRSRALLYSILPEHIAKNWSMKGDKMFASRHDAAVLFTDIVGFTALSRETQPEHVIIFLNEVFNEIDRRIAEHGVRKIKTIGDAYMVCAGLSEGEEDPVDATRRLGELALRLSVELEAATRELCAFTGLPPLRMRIGMHCGPVVAGVIGNQRPAYDVWGDTVNMASRLESSGIPGRVHVSAEVRKMLEPEFRFEERGKIDLKGVGQITTHFLSGRR